MNDQTGLPPKDHNNPPEAIVMPVLPGEATPEQIERAQKAAVAKTGGGDQELVAFSPDKHAELSAHVAVFCDAAGKWLDIKQVQSAEQSERLTDFVTGARGLFKRVDEARKEAKKPWDDLGQMVQDAYTPLTAKLDKLGKSMKAMQADWLARENARIAKERAEAEAKARAEREAAQKAAQEAAARNDISGQVEAEEALKAAQKAEKQAAKPVKAQAGSATGGGRKMSLRTTKHARVTNKRACFMYFQNDPAVDELLERLATAAVRSGNITEANKALAGVDIYTKEGAA
ncbi:hypothetical protein [Roseinatronobacter sp. NSM]|uniref:hypothetical protein n=1 Tax=Roseinatronobacter sp. NSM TaxID=3457785 RepID=UPI0040365B0A